MKTQRMADQSELTYYAHKSTSTIRNRPPLGEFGGWLIPLLGGGLTLVAVIGCYYISQWYGHQKPFPHTYISATANHFPEYILFRIGTMPGAVFIILSHFVNLFWLQSLCHQSNYKLPTAIFSPGLILGIMGGIMLLGSTANLDTGTDNVNLHIFCATSFFLLSNLSLTCNALVNFILLIDGVKGIQLWAVIYKVLVAIFSLLSTYLALTTKDKLHGSDFSNELEYCLAFGIIASHLGIAYDLRSVKMVYQYKQSTHKQSQSL